MGDTYLPYGASADRASVGRSTFPGYLTSEAASLASHHDLRSSDMMLASSDFVQRDINSLRPGAYGLKDISGVGVYSEPGLGGVTSSASLKTYTSLEDPTSLSQRRDVASGISQSTTDVINSRSSSLRNVDGVPSSAGESNVLFVDGLPNDCSRREVGHLFRPFIGYKDIKVIHKEPRHSGDRAMVLCFVEFADPKCAVTAMEALQGYKFDDKKPDAPTLRITYAHFPFRHPSGRDEQRIRIPS
ncbi:RRM_1 domain-containing protein [Cephalotus follicularis]|uniref:RRM_1 domain-containing protein n=1 Tax=Cephalotus follicularis TaxID=3775 RepID=A0A1Q3AN43_CEPFO|nr:RRM_1 domain-containing protein [Cephalotus follicularis]